MSKKAKKKELRAIDALDAPKRVVEIEISVRCEHECFAIWTEERAVFRIPGYGSLYRKKGDPIVAHHCDDDEHTWCVDVCWEENEHA